MSRLRGRVGGYKDEKVIPFFFDVYAISPDFQVSYLSYSQCLLLVEPNKEDWNYKRNDKHN